MSVTKLVSLTYHIHLMSDESWHVNNKYFHERLYIQLVWSDYSSNTYYYYYSSSLPLIPSSSYAEKRTIIPSAIKFIENRGNKNKCL